MTEKSQIDYISILIIKYTVVIFKCYENLWS